MAPAEVRVVLVASRKARKATQTNDPESGIAPDTDEGSSRLSRRNVIIGGVAVVAAINLPKNSLASTPLSTADQPSENNNGEDDNMNSTTDIPEDRADL